MRDYSGTVTITGDGDDGEEVTLEVTATFHEDRGRTYGPPEKCYPDESYLNVEEIVNVKTEQLWPGELTEEQESEVIEKLMDKYEAAREEHYEHQADLRRENREDRS